MLWGRILLFLHSNIILLLTIFYKVVIMFSKHKTAKLFWTEKMILFGRMSFTNSNNDAWIIKSM